MENRWSTFYLYFPRGEEDEDIRLMKLAGVALTIERRASDEVIREFICSKEYGKLIKLKEKEKWKQE